eukprot:TRINITY_DN54876_c0_g1_i1.p1 TRINITY_DN54876_c0_g1~~TRINITY_DN54876_c0_g1_i1.p1  ORF type:complete len:121 (-),score=9.12 TRINITY_DN54876_c0_g1_i1:275-586(-)
MLAYKKLRSEHSSIELSTSTVPGSKRLTPAFCGAWYSYYIEQMMTKSLMTKQMYSAVEGATCKVRRIVDAVLCKYWYSRDFCAFAVDGCRPHFEGTVAGGEKA